MDAGNKDWRQAAFESLQDRVAVVAVTLTLLLLLALPDLPYGYYRFLRVAVSLGGIYLAYRLHQENQILWLLVAVAAVILFNPIYDMEFEEDEWKFIDALFGGAFAGLALWRMMPAARRKGVFGAAGMVAALGAAVIVGGRGDYSNSWDSGANTTVNFADDTLMEVTGVDALNMSASLPGYDPIPPVDDGTIADAIGDTENRTNLLQELLAPTKPDTPPESAVNSSLNNGGNAAEETANAIANLGAEEGD